MILSTTSLDNFIQLIVVLVIFAFVLAITYFTTRFIGGYQKTKLNNKNMKVIETMRLGNNKFIALIELKDHYMVVGVGKDEINAIAKYSKDELPDIEEYGDIVSNSHNSSFQDILNNLNMKNKKG